jgi:hypothetical protein
MTHLIVTIVVHVPIIIVWAIRYLYIVVRLYTELAVKSRS